MLEERLEENLHELTDDELEELAEELTDRIDCDTPPELARKMIDRAGRIHSILMSRAAAARVGRREK